MTIFQFHDMESKKAITKNAPIYNFPIDQTQKRMPFVSKKDVLLCFSDKSTTSPVKDVKSPKHTVASDLVLTAANEPLHGTTDNSSSWAACANLRNLKMRIDTFKAGTHSNTVPAVALCIKCWAKAISLIDILGLAYNHI